MRRKKKMDKAMSIAEINQLKEDKMQLSNELSFANKKIKRLVEAFTEETIQKLALLEKVEELTAVLSLIIDFSKYIETGGVDVEEIFKKIEEIKKRSGISA